MNTTKPRRDTVFISGFPHSFDPEVFWNHAETKFGQCELHKTWQRQEQGLLFVVLRFKSAAHASVLLRRYNGRIVLGHKIGVNWYDEARGPGTGRRRFQQNTFQENSKDIASRTSHSSSRGRGHTVKDRLGQMRHQYGDDDEYEDERKMLEDRRYWAEEGSYDDGEQAIDTYWHDEDWGDQVDVAEGYQHLGRGRKVDSSWQRNYERTNEVQHGYDEARFSGDAEANEYWEENPNYDHRPSHERPQRQRGIQHRLGRYEEDNPREYYDDYEERAPNLGYKQERYIESSVEEGECDYTDSDGYASQENPRVRYLYHNERNEQFRRPARPEQRHQMEYYRDEERGPSWDAQACPEYAERSFDERHITQNQDFDDSWDYEWERSPTVGWDGRGRRGSTNEIEYNDRLPPPVECKSLERIHRGKPRCVSPSRLTHEPPRRARLSTRHASRSRAGHRGRIRGRGQRPSCHVRGRNPPRDALMTRAKFLSRNVFEDESYESTTSDDMKSPNGKRARRENISRVTHASKTRGSHMTRSSDQSASSSQTGNLLCDANRARELTEGELESSESAGEVNDLRSVVRIINTQTEKENKVIESKANDGPVTAASAFTSDKRIALPRSSRKRGLPRPESDTPVKKAKSQVKPKPKSKRIVRPGTPQISKSVPEIPKAKPAPAKSSGLKTKRAVRLVGKTASTSTSTVTSLEAAAPEPVDEPKDGDESLPEDDLRRVIMSRRIVSVTVVNTDDSDSVDVVPETESSLATKDAATETELIEAGNVIHVKWDICMDQEIEVCDAPEVFVEEKDPFVSGIPIMDLAGQHVKRVVVAKRMDKRCKTLNAEGTSEGHKVMLRSHARRRPVCTDSETETSSSQVSDDPEMTKATTRRRVIPPRKQVAKASQVREKQKPSESLASSSPVTRSKNLLNDLAKALSIRSLGKESTRGTLAERGNWNEKSSESDGNDPAVKRRETRQKDMRITSKEHMITRKIVQQPVEGQYSDCPESMDEELVSCEKGKSSGIIKNLSGLSSTNEVDDGNEVEMSRSSLKEHEDLAAENTQKIVHSPEVQEPETISHDTNNAHGKEQQILSSSPVSMHELDGENQAEIDSSSLKEQQDLVAEITQKIVHSPEVQEPETMSYDRNNATDKEQQSLSSSPVSKHEVDDEKEAEMANCSLKDNDDLAAETTENIVNGSEDQELGTMIYIANNPSDKEHEILSSSPLSKNEVDSGNETGMSNSSLKEHEDLGTENTQKIDHKPTDQELGAVIYNASNACDKENRIASSSPLSKHEVDDGNEAGMSSTSFKETEELATAITQTIVNRHEDQERGVMNNDARNSHEKEQRIVSSRPLYKDVVDDEDEAEVSSDSANENEGLAAEITQKIVNSDANNAPDKVEQIAFSRSLSKDDEGGNEAHISRSSLKQNGDLVAEIAQKIINSPKAQELVVTNNGANNEPDEEERTSLTQSSCEGEDEPEASIESTCYEYKRDSPNFDEKECIEKEEDRQSQTPEDDEKDDVGSEDEASVDSDVTDERDLPDDDYQLLQYHLAQEDANTSEESSQVRDDSESESGLLTSTPCKTSYGYTSVLSTGTSVGDIEEKDELLDAELEENSPEYVVVDECEQSDEDDGDASGTGSSDNSKTTQQNADYLSEEDSSEHSHEKHSQECTEDTANMPEVRIGEVSVTETDDSCCLHLGQFSDVTETSDGEVRSKLTEEENIKRNLISGGSYEISGKERSGNLEGQFSDCSEHKEERDHMLTSDTNIILHIESQISSKPLAISGNISGDEERANKSAERYICGGNSTRGAAEVFHIEGNIAPSTKMEEQTQTLMAGQYSDWSDLEKAHADIDAFSLENPCSKPGCECAPEDKDGQGISQVDTTTGENHEPSKLSDENGNIQPLNVENIVEVPLEGQYSDLSENTESEDQNGDLTRSIDNKETVHEERFSQDVHLVHDTSSIIHENCDQGNSVIVNKEESSQLHPTSPVDKNSPVNNVAKGSSVVSCDGAPEASLNQIHDLEISSLEDENLALRSRSGHFSDISDSIEDATETVTNEKLLPNLEMLSASEEALQTNEVPTETVHVVGFNKPVQMATIDPKSCYSVVSSEDNACTSFDVSNQHGDTTTDALFDQIASNDMGDNEDSNLGQRTRYCSVGQFSDISDGIEGATHTVTMEERLSDQEMLEEPSERKAGETAHADEFGTQLQKTTIDSNNYFLVDEKFESYVKSERNEACDAVTGFAIIPQRLGATNGAFQITASHDHENVHVGSSRYGSAGQFSDTSDVIEGDAHKVTDVNFEFEEETSRIASHDSQGDSAVSGKKDREQLSNEVCVEPSTAEGELHSLANHEVSFDNPLPVNDGEECSEDWSLKEIYLTAEKAQPELNNEAKNITPVQETSRKLDNSVAGLEKCHNASNSTESFHVSADIIQSEVTKGTNNIPCDAEFTNTAAIDSKYDSDHYDPSNPTFANENKESHAELNHVTVGLPEKAPFAAVPREKNASQIIDQLDYYDPSKPTRDECEDISTNDPTLRAGQENDLTNSLKGCDSKYDPSNPTCDCEMIDNYTKGTCAGDTINESGLSFLAPRVTNVPDHGNSYYDPLEPTHDNSEDVVTKDVSLDPKTGHQTDWIAGEAPYSAPCNSSTPTAKAGASPVLSEASQVEVEAQLEDENGPNYIPNSNLPLCVDLDECQDNSCMRSGIAIEKFDVSASPTTSRGNFSDTPSNSGISQSENGQLQNETEAHNAGNIVEQMEPSCRNDENDISWKKGPLPIYSNFLEKDALFAAAPREKNASEIIDKTDYYDPSKPTSVECDDVSTDDLSLCNGKENDVTNSLKGCHSEYDPSNPTSDCESQTTDNHTKGTWAGDRISEAGLSYVVPRLTNVPDLGNSYYDPSEPTHDISEDVTTKDVSLDPKTGHQADFIAGEASDSAHCEPSTHTEKAAPNHVLSEASQVEVEAQFEYDNGPNYIPNRNRPLCDDLDGSCMQSGIAIETYEVGASPTTSRRNLNNTTNSGIFQSENGQLQNETEAHNAGNIVDQMDPSCRNDENISCKVGPLLLESSSLDKDTTYTQDTISDDDVIEVFKEKAKPEVIIIDPSSESEADTFEEAKRSRVQCHQQTRREISSADHDDLWSMALAKEQHSSIDKERDYGQSVYRERSPREDMSREFFRYGAPFSVGIAKSLSDSELANPSRLIRSEETENMEPVDMEISSDHEHQGTERPEPVYMERSSGEPVVPVGHRIVKERGNSLFGITQRASRFRKRFEPYSPGSATPLSDSEWERETRLSNKTLREQLKNVFDDFMHSFPAKRRNKLPVSTIFDSLRKTSRPYDPENISSVHDISSSDSSALPYDPERCTFSKNASISKAVPSKRTLKSYNPDDAPLFQELSSSDSNALPYDPELARPLHGLLPNVNNAIVGVAFCSFPKDSSREEPYDPEATPLAHVSSPDTSAKPYDPACCVHSNDSTGGESTVPYDPACPLNWITSGEESSSKIVIDSDPCRFRKDVSLQRKPDYMYDRPAGVRNENETGVAPDRELPSPNSSIASSSGGDADEELSMGVSSADLYSLVGDGREDGELTESDDGKRHDNPNMNVEANSNHSTELDAKETQSKTFSRRIVTIAGCRKENGPRTESTKSLCESQNKVPTNPRSCVPDGEFVLSRRYSNSSESGSSCVNEPPLNLPTDDQGNRLPDFDRVHSRRMSNSSESSKSCEGCLPRPTVSMVKKPASSETQRRRRKSKDVSDDEGSRSRRRSISSESGNSSLNVSSHSPRLPDKSKHGSPERQPRSKSSAIRSIVFKSKTNASLEKEKKHDVDLSRKSSTTPQREIGDKEGHLQTSTPAKSKSHPSSLKKKKSKKNRSAEDANKKKYRSHAEKSRSHSPVPKEKHETHKRRASFSETARSNNSKESSSVPSAHSTEDANKKKSRPHTEKARSHSPVPKEKHETHKRRASFSETARSNNSKECSSVPSAHSTENANKKKSRQHDEKARSHSPVPKEKHETHKRRGSFSETARSNNSKESSSVPSAHSTENANKKKSRSHAEKARSHSPVPKRGGSKSGTQTPKNSKKRTSSQSTEKANVKKSRTRAKKTRLSHSLASKEKHEAPKIRGSIIGTPRQKNSEPSSSTPSAPTSTKGKSNLCDSSVKVLGSSSKPLSVSSTYSSNSKSTKAVVGAKEGTSSNQVKAECKTSLNDNRNHPAASGTASSNSTATKSGGQPFSILQKLKCIMKKSQKRPSTSEGGTDDTDQGNNKPKKAKLDNEMSNLLDEGQDLLEVALEESTSASRAEAKNSDLKSPPSEHKTLSEPATSPVPDSSVRGKLPVTATSDTTTVTKNLPFKPPLTKEAPPDIEAENALDTPLTADSTVGPSISEKENPVFVPPLPSSPPPHTPALIDVAPLPSRPQEKFLNTIPPARIICPPLPSSPPPSTANVPLPDERPRPPNLTKDPRLRIRRQSIEAPGSLHSIYQVPGTSRSAGNVESPKTVHSPPCAHSALYVENVDSIGGSSKQRKLNVEERESELPTSSSAGTVAVLSPQDKVDASSSSDGSDNSRKKRLSTAQFEQKVTSILQKRIQVEEEYKKECATLVDAVKKLASKKKHREIELQEMLHKTLQEIGQKYVNELTTFVRKETN